jgi:5-hydroxyisourate hydrolase
MTGRITTHVLDTSKGVPASGIEVILEYNRGSWQELGKSVTDGDGRAGSLTAPENTLAPGMYRLTFGTMAYHRKQNVDAFYPRVVIEFEVKDGTAHYHVPLLLSPFGYSTYRGS